jgi:hypothetical protein
LKVENEKLEKLEEVNKWTSTSLRAPVPFGYDPHP